MLSFPVFFRKKKKLLPEQQQKINDLEKVIGLRCHNPKLFLRALTHRSKLVDEHLNDTDSYEQLEFLGDAVLDLIVAEILFEKYPDENEGFMTKSRSKLVKGVTLAKLARNLELNTLLILGERAKGQGVEMANSVLADVFEALIGAIYRDRGYQECSNFVRSVYAKFLDIDDYIHVQDNYKSILLEYSQANKLPIPTYSVLSESGPAHLKEFQIGVYLGNDLVGKGNGNNKKIAEQLAAMMALKKISKKTPD